MPAYIDVSEFLAARLPEVVKETEITAITATILAASAFADRVCGRAAGYFSVAAADPSTRFFRGDGTGILRIPKHVAGSATVENIPVSAYYENPDNGWLYKYTESELADLDEVYVNGGTSDQYPLWTHGKRYAVAARWGFEAIPADLAEAVAMITLRWWETQKGTLGQITPNGFVIERDVPPAAASILATYTRGEFEI